MQERGSGVMVEGGWLSSYGELLNLCCVACGVWVSIDEKKRLREFDGMPHRCTPAQARVKPGSLL
jgi:hypothetical protein